MRPYVVDTQQHELTPLLVNSPEDGSRYPEGDTRYELMTETLLAWMDAVGVDLTVLNPLDDAVADWACRHVPERFRTVPTMIEPDDALVDMARRQPGVVGVRILAVGFLGPDGHPSAAPEALARLAGGDYDTVLSACEQHGIPVFMFAQGHVAPLAAVAEAYPDLTMVVDHFGLAQPPMVPLSASPWAGFDNLLELSRYPRVFVKACGAPALSHEPYPFKDVWPHLHQLIDAFGADRLMWGSDIARFEGRMGWNAWELGRHAQNDYAGKHTYAESLALFRDSDEISSSQKEMILGGTARQVLSLD